MLLCCFRLKTFIMKYPSMNIGVVKASLRFGIWATRNFPAKIQKFESCLQVPWLDLHSWDHGKSKFRAGIFFPSQCFKHRGSNPVIQIRKCMAFITFFGFSSPFKCFALSPDKLELVEWTKYQTQM